MTTTSDAPSLEEESEAVKALWGISNSPAPKKFRSSSSSASSASCLTPLTKGAAGGGAANGGGGDIMGFPTPQGGPSSPSMNYNRFFSPSQFSWSPLPGHSPAPQAHHHHHHHHQASSLQSAVHVSSSSMPTFFSSLSSSSCSSASHSSAVGASGGMVEREEMKDGGGKAGHASAGEEISTSTNTNNKTTKKKAYSKKLDFTGPPTEKAARVWLSLDTETQRVARGSRPPPHPISPAGVAMSALPAGAEDPRFTMTMTTTQSPFKFQGAPEVVDYFGTSSSSSSSSSVNGAGINVSQRSGGSLRGAAAAAAAAAADTTRGAASFCLQQLGGGAGGKGEGDDDEEAAVAEATAALLDGEEEDLGLKEWHAEFEEYVKQQHFYHQQEVEEGAQQQQQQQQHGHEQYTNMELMAEETSRPSFGCSASIESKRLPITPLPVNAITMNKHGGSNWGGIQVRVKKSTPNRSEEDAALLETLSGMLPIVNEASRSPFPPPQSPRETINAARKGFAPGSPVLEAMAMVTLSQSPSVFSAEKRKKKMMEGRGGGGLAHLSSKVLPFAAAAATSSTAAAAASAAAVVRKQEAQTHTHTHTPNQTPNAHAHQQHHRQKSETAAASLLPVASGAGASPASSATCSCKKSRCLKLYCACFCNGNICGVNCKCQNCANTPEFEAERAEAMEKIMGKKKRKSLLCGGVSSNENSNIHNIITSTSSGSGSGSSVVTPGGEKKELAVSRSSSSSSSSSSTSTFMSPPKAMHVFASGTGGLRRSTDGTNKITFTLMHPSCAAGSSSSSSSPQLVGKPVRTTAATRQQQQQQQFTTTTTTTPLPASKTKTPRKSNGSTPTDMRSTKKARVGGGTPTPSKAASARKDEFLLSVFGPRSRVNKANSLQVFSYLDNDDMADACLVSSLWNNLALQTLEE